MISAQSVPASDGLFLTNRCGGCGRALTKLEILERLQEGPICPCGSNKFHSSNFKLWEELLLLRSWKLLFAWKAGLLAPPPSKEEVAANRQSMIRQIVELNKADLPGEDV